MISGTPQTGSALTATAAWTGDPPPVAAWTWLRCARDKGGRCQEIDGAAGPEYSVTATDVGAFLRVRLTLTSEAGRTEGRSEPTTAVVDAPVPTPTFDTSTPVTPTTPSAPAPPPATPRLKPFPVVRIKGSLTASGARVSLLSVKAPAGVRITVRCRGRDCPSRRFVARPGVRRLRRYERSLRAGTRLEITVTKAGYIGKFTRIVIRRGAAPWRSDRCLEPGAKRSVRCS